MNELKLCPGYLDHPEHMTDEFYEDDSYCRPCRKESNDKHNPRNNAVISLTEKYIPQRVRRKHPLRKEMHAFAVEVFKGNETERELQKIIRGCLIGYLDGTYMDTNPVDEALEFVFPKKESSVIRTTVRNEKTRNHGLRAPLIRIYNHECQVEHCHETEVEVSHVLAHHLKDSVDDETNVRLFCVVHHRAYDGGRMPIDDNNEFVRYNHHGTLVETGRIIYDDRHKINPTFAKRTREHHESRKEQTVG
jgi:hypothetical protein